MSDIGATASDDGRIVRAMEMTLPAGYVARLYGGPADHPGMTCVRNSSSIAVGDGDLRTVEWMDVGYANLENCDPAADIAVIEWGDEIVGYGRVTWLDPLDDARTYELLAWAEPEHRAVLDGFFEWLENRALALATEHGFRRFVLVGDAALRPEGAPPELYRWSEVLASRSMELVRHQLSMVRADMTEAEALPLPDAVEIRPVTEEHLRAIWEAQAEAFLDHPGGHAAAESEWAEFLAFPHRDLSLWKVAWVGDEVVGQVRSYVNDEENERFGRRRGYTENISTARAWRGKGVAGALLSASIVDLRERGFTEAALAVMVENTTGALPLYTRLGFMPYATTGVYRRLVEV